jgi:ABC-type glutathione transport system ATPase component
MGVVSDLAERIVVMYAGSVVEEGPKAAVFREPQHGSASIAPPGRVPPPARGRFPSPRKDSEMSGHEGRMSRAGHETWYRVVGELDPAAPQIPSSSATAVRALRTTTPSRSPS